MHQRALVLKLLPSRAQRAAVGCQSRGPQLWRARARRLDRTPPMARPLWVGLPFLGVRCSNPQDDYENKNFGPYATAKGALVGVCRTWVFRFLIVSTCVSSSAQDGACCINQVIFHFTGVRMLAVRFGAELLGQGPALRRAARGLLRAATSTSTRRRTASGSSLVLSRCGKNL